MGFDGEVVAEVIPVVNAIGVIGGGGGQEADPGSAFAGEGDHLFDEGFLESTAVGQDLFDRGIGRGGAGLSLGRCKEQDGGECEEQGSFHSYNVQNRG